MPLRAVFSVLLAVLLAVLFLASCGSTGSYRNFGPPNMGGPSAEARKAQIANEPGGSFFYGRRYYVYKTRFWGYLRKPGQPWSNAKLVIFREDNKHNPDRLPEDGPLGQRYGFDQNYEYRIEGYYTGETDYEPNSDQFLPEFMLTGYTLVDRNPGWIFHPDDHYDPIRVTLLP
jgi:hypothetical protein